MVDAWQAQPGHQGTEDWRGLLWPHQQFETRTRARLRAFARRASIIKAFSVEAAERVDEGSLDFVFIDADHSTPGVLADIEAWRPKLKPGGTLMGHDASWPSVERALALALPRGWWPAPDDVWVAR